MASRHYFGCKVAQRGVGNSVEFVVFVVRTKDIMQWAGIRRVGEHEKGTQRILKQARMRAIKRFFEADQRNTIPVSVLIAFDPDRVTFASLHNEIKSCLPQTDIQNDVGDKLDWGILSFEFAENLEEHQRPALIVDGQHRLHGTDQLQNEDVPILVAALIEATPEEQAFQFVVINNKAAKVPTDNVKAIMSTIDEDELQKRLLKAGVSYGDMPAILSDIDSQEESPFRGMLDWPLNPKERRVVKLNTIEACLDYIAERLPVLEEDEDTKKEVFYAIWRAIASHFSELWLTNDKFMTKVNLNALNEFVVDGIAYAWMGNIVDVFDTGSVEAQTKNILKLTPKEFWERKWSQQIKIQDNSVIRSLIKDELGMVSQNSRMGKKNVFEKSRLIINGENSDVDIYQE